MQKGFFGSLFDLSFSSLVTTKIIKVLYVLALIVIGLGALALIITGFADSVTSGVLMLVIVAPLFALLYVVYTRVILEVVIVLFRILETNQQIAANTAGGASPADPAGFAPPSTPVA